MDNGEGQLTVGIGSNERLVFKQIVLLLRPILFQGLTNKELDVLSQILYYHDRFKHLDSEMKWDMVFMRKHRKEMAQYLEMNQDNFDNYVSALRRKDVLKGDRIDKKYLFTLKEDSDHYYIVFDLKVQKSGDGKQGAEGGNKEEEDDGSWIEPGD